MARRRNKRQNEKTTQPVVKPKKRPSWEWLLTFGSGAAVAAILTASATHYVMSAPSPKPLAIQPVQSAAKDFPTVGTLASMSDEELSKQDLAMVNLRCAEGLLGADKLDINKQLQTLDGWARHVKAETDRHLYRVRDPRYAELYQNSEQFFRASMMLQVLQQDLKVSYNHDRIDDVDFTKSKDLFIHGMVGSDNGGTCVSMPVLYTVMGRRLGYPIKLVVAKAHVFCRWDGPNDQFNIEGAGEGFSSFDNEYYTKWPKPLSESEVKSGYYLRSLSPREELAIFLAARGHCLEDNRRLNESYVAYAQANALAPKHPVYGSFLSAVVMKRPDARRMVSREVKWQLEQKQTQAANQARLNARLSSTFPTPESFNVQQTGYQGSNEWGTNQNVRPHPGFPMGNTNPAFGTNQYQPIPTGQPPYGNAGL